jgi:large subunit ribosomal protein L23
MTENSLVAAANQPTSNEQVKTKTELANWRSVMKSNFSTENIMADLIKYPVITEKSYIALFKNKQYTFDVDLRLTKPQIKALFKKLFNVEIIGINTHRPPRKKVRVGLAQGYKARYKRVIITLKEGQSINFDTFLSD